jgi:Fanconi-associated nuclease 1
MQGRRVSRSDAAGLHQNADMHPAKRLKTNEKADCEDHSSLGDSDTVSDVETPRSYRLEIPDSEEDDELNDEHILEDQRPTELENALPPVRTDREAIAEYESMRATSGDMSIDLKERLDSGNWTKGKSSIYVDAFNLALDTVLEDESHLFDEAETAVFSQWKSLDYEAQYLSVALPHCLANADNK